MKRLVLCAVVLLAVSGAGWCEGVKVFGADWFADTPFPQFMNLWHEGFALSQGQDYLLQKDAPGGYVFVHFENTAGKPVKVTDLAVEGVKLSEGLPRRRWQEFRICPHEELERPSRVHIDPLGFVHLCQGIVLGNAWQRELVDIMSQYDP